MDRRHLQGLGFGERRQNAREAGGQHRFAGSRRPDHQHAMRAGRSNLECALRLLLAFHIAEICIGRRHSPRLALEGY
jgi:hypothetical protein